jgi:transcriptional regulator with XRE-family HTH domain
MSQAELADRAGVRQPTMYRYEKCGMVPGGEAMAKIAAALGVSSYWLVHGEHEAQPNFGEPAAGRAPPHWNAFLSNYEYLDDLSEADLQAMKSFAARTHRIRSWYDWAQLAEWLRNRKPSTIFERTKAQERG